MKQDGSRQASINRVAQVYIHEVGHNLNLRHREMISSLDIHIDFLEAGKIEFKIACSPKMSVASVNEEKARKKLAEWTKKSNKAKKFVIKYQKKVKYYDKKREKVIL